MSEWHNTIGYPQLGREGTPDYRGYVVKVQGTEDGHPEQWFTYAYDQAEGFHYWIGMTGSEDEAKALLDRLLSEGWKCEVYDSHAGRHCRDRAVMVRHIWYEGKTMGERLRVLLCEGHGSAFRTWERMTIREYIRRFEALEQDAPVIGPRR